MLIPESGLRILVPEWMLDDAFCSSLELRPEPRVDLPALRSLRELIDLQQFKTPATMTAQSPATQGESHGEESAESAAGPPADA